MPPRSVFKGEGILAEQQFFYGGQAVIEGVMIRGRRYFSLAVRRLNGDVETVSEPLSQMYTGRLRRVVFPTRNPGPYRDAGSGD